MLRYKRITESRSEDQISCYLTRREKSLLQDLAVPADQRAKIKESEKISKYLNFVRELKKLWNMEVTVIPIEVGVLGTENNRRPEIALS